ncbi:hypothetical protein [Kribbella sp. NPDC048915]|uniref:hypothetical protein n=1 Tax=Kribbella sp. NPDC048915 TaxID=3155148 RepID=UPI0033FA56D1
MDKLPTPSIRVGGPGGAANGDEADSRQTALGARKLAVEAGESARVGLDQEIEAILEAADERDRQADDRDAAADERDQAASLDSFLHDADYGPGLKARRLSAMDRLASKDDRTAGADDRRELTRMIQERSELED